MVLVALPEAVTTPIGLALILTSRYLSKRIEANLYKRLHETFQHYLAHYKRRDGATDKPKDQNQTGRLPWQKKPKTSQPSNVIGSIYNEARLIPIQPKNDSAKDQPIPLNWQSQRKAPANVIHHTMDWNKLSPHYGTVTGSKFAPIPEVRPARDVKLVRHDIDMKALARRYQTIDSPQVEPDSSAWEAPAGSDKPLKHHNIDMQKLSRRFKSEESSEADLSSADTSREVVLSHSLNIKAIQPYDKAEEPPPAPPKHHAIDMASLQRRYGAPALR
jgi:hypothetical protein